MERSRHRLLHVDSDDSFHSAETGDNRHTPSRKPAYSPKAAPPAAPPPPPPKFNSDDDDEEDSSYVQEKHYPETSLPPETQSSLYYHKLQNRQEYYEQEHPYAVGRFIDPQHYTVLPQSNHTQTSESMRELDYEHPLAEVGEGSPDPQPPSRVAHSHSYLAVETMPPSKHVRPKTSDPGGRASTTSSTKLPQEYSNTKESTYRTSETLDPENHQVKPSQNGVDLDSNHGPVPSAGSNQHLNDSLSSKDKNKRVKSHQPTLQRNEGTVPTADQSLVQSPYQYAYRQHGHEGTSAFTIRYEEDAKPVSQQRISVTAGNSFLSPNVGLTNSYEYALWGLAPHELLRFLQRLDSVASLACLVIASLSWLGKLLFFHWDQLVLLAYLAALSFVLLFVEIMAIVTPEQQRLIPNNFMGRIRDQLGLLFNPWGKAFFVLLLTTMCWGMENIFLSMVGTVYFVASLGWFYAACVYREDLPRLMGSIDETHRAEARRRHARQSNFSVSSWTAFMENPAVAARESWTNVMQQSTTVYEQENEEEEIDFTHEQSSLLQNRQ